MAYVCFCKNISVDISMAKILAKENEDNTDYVSTIVYIMSEKETKVNDTKENVVHHLTTSI